MAKKQIHTFGAAKAQKLSSIADSWGSMSRDGLSFAPNAVGKWVMKANTPITACDYRCEGSGVTQSPVPGFGTAAICYRDRITGQIKVHEPSGMEITCTVYSLLGEVIPAGWFFLATRDLAGTIWAESVFKKCEDGSGGGSGLAVDPGTHNTLALGMFLGGSLVEARTCR